MRSQISILRHHMYKATELGADFRELCNRLKVTPELLADGEAHAEYDFGGQYDFWIHALELTGDPCLGLHMGKLRDKHNPFGILGLLAGSSRTVGDAFEIVCRYNDTLSTVFEYRLERTEKDASFFMTPHPLWEESNLESARQAVDMSISSWLCRLNEAALRKVYPIQLELRYPKRFEREYKDVVNSPVLFNQPHNRFVFRKDDLDIPLMNYDHSLSIAFESLLLEKRKRLMSINTTSGSVKNVLLSNFNGQGVHIDIVSSTLNMTTRTLQRKLSEENTSYRQICQDLRRSLANDLMKVGKKNKGQVATMLGYADVSTFNRALKNWKK